MAWRACSTAGPWQRTRSLMASTLTHTQVNTTWGLTFR